ncbi:hypothetical protein Bequi_06260 [Brachybacterium sp. JHP9]|uniref:Uncharacterized protein n=1 Tax=Brachybacterium equifaecis TaxID=2910770 RepID=A0ABT0R242_9MICO|nr:hypothetical protein [Brachybacterium equifaecis]MCL6422995.1 hypothetical protein [Brachybacterium equifaecis]
MRPAGERPASPLVPGIVGACSFVLVLALIVGGGLALRQWWPGAADPVTGGSSTPSGGAGSSGSSGGGEDGSGEGSGAALAPIDPAPECWYATDNARTSSDPAGGLRAGGLEVDTPAVFTDTYQIVALPFAVDSTTAYAEVEANWISSVTLARVRWDGATAPGYGEYPGAQAAAERMLACLLADDTIWEGTSARTVTRYEGGPVSVDGMSGFQVEADQSFTSDIVTATSASHLQITVVDTPGGPAVMMTDAADGLTDHEDGVRAARESLRRAG